MTATAVVAVVTSGYAPEVTPADSADDDSTQPSQGASGFANDETGLGGGDAAAETPEALPHSAGQRAIDDSKVTTTSARSSKRSLGEMLRAFARRL